MGYIKKTKPKKVRKKKRMKKQWEKLENIQFESWFKPKYISNNMNNKITLITLVE